MDLCSEASLLCVGVEGCGVVGECVGIVGGIDVCCTV